MKDQLDERDLVSFVQTGGARGLDLVVPLDRSADFDRVRDFARSLAEYLASAHPDMHTVERRKSKRGDRVFLDQLRNAYGQTAVAPCALRAIEVAPLVSGTLLTSRSKTVVLIHPGVDLLRGFIPGDSVSFLH